MDWHGKRVLVTGGSGFLGSHLVAELIRHDCNVTVADDFSRGRIENISLFLNRISLAKVDLTNFESCLRVTNNADCIFHLAASVGGIQYIQDENVQNLTPSVMMNTNILESSVRNGAERLLFASSACVYREKSLALNQFKEEDAYPAEPATTYGWAKILGEIQCKAYHDDFDLKTSCVRIFNCYGEQENLDPRWSHVIPSLIRKAILYPEEGFRVYGDGRQERGFLYVKDCIEGFFRIMERVDDATAINLGGPEIVSISELARKVVDISGKPIKIEYDPSGPQGTHRYCADLRRLKELVNWVPKTTLDEGLRRTYLWAKEVLAQRT